METKHELRIPYGYGSAVAIIPAGTPVIEAINIPRSKPHYWVEQWEGMSDQEESEQRNYGFLVSSDQVE